MNMLKYLFSNGTCCASLYKCRGSCKIKELFAHEKPQPMPSKTSITECSMSRF